MKKRRNRGKNGKTVGNGSISKTRNSGRISVIWLLLAVVVVWIIRALKSPNGNAFRDNNRWRY